MRKTLQVCLFTFVSCLPVAGISEVTVDRFTGNATCTGIVFPQTEDGHVIMGTFRYVKIAGDYFGPYMVLNVTSARPAGLANGDADFLFTTPDGLTTRLTGEVFTAAGSGANEQVTYIFSDSDAAEEIFSSAMQIEYRLNGPRGSFEGRLDTFMVNLSINKCSERNWPE